MSSISELEKWLMKHVLEGKEGAGATRDFLKSKMRQNIMGRIANSHGATPSGASLDMLTKGSEDVAEAGRNLLRTDREVGIDPEFMTDAMMRYASLTKPRRGGT